jgi:hypothetical protein
MKIFYFIYFFKIFNLLLKKKIKKKNNILKNPIKELSGF